MDAAVSEPLINGMCELDAAPPERMNALPQICIFYIGLSYIAKKHFFCVIKYIVYEKTKTIPADSSAYSGGWLFARAKTAKTRIG